MGRRSWAAIAAVCGVAATTLITLGDDSPGVSLADAAERIEGESMHQRLTIGYTDSTGTYSMSGEGIVAADSSRLSYDLKVSMKGEPGSYRMVMRNIGQDFWFRVPRLERYLPRGKPWVHAVDNMAPATLLTPSELAEFLTEADEISELGEDRVLGQTATHYQGTLDLEELADEIGGDTRKRLEEALERENFPEDKKPGMPIEAWISEEGLPIRLRIYGTERGGDSLDMTTDILEYGVRSRSRRPRRHG